MNSLPNPGELAQCSMVNPNISSQISDMTRRKTATIALVDEVVLSRDCLVQSLLPRFGQDIAIKPFASIEGLLSSEPTRFDLMLLYVHDNPGEYFQTIVEAIVDIPMPVLVITDNKLTDLRMFFRDALRAGICGLVSAADTGSKLLSAATRFALSGGTFFPSELIVRDSASAIRSSVPKKARSGLTARQAEVFVKLQEGKPNKIIAYELGMSESTVKVHIRAIMKSIGATNRTQAVFLAQQRPSSNARRKCAFNVI